MSKTFDVYPSTKETPLISAVAALAHRRLQAYAADFGLGGVPAIHFTLHDAQEEISPLNNDARMNWSATNYVWFQFGNAIGGTDAYCRTVDEEHVTDWERESSERAPARQMANHIRRCLILRRYWYFRRSAGQHAIVNLGYGFLAAALAELTDGFIHSEDSAWDYVRFPCRAEDFYRFYFRPEHALEENFREWSARNISSLKKDGMEA